MPSLMLDSGARVGRALTCFGAGPVPTVLVQHEPGDRAARAPLERDLRIGLLDEEVAGRLGPELHRPVPCARLGEERVLSGPRVLEVREALAERVVGVLEVLGDVAD